MQYLPRMRKILEERPIYGTPPEPSEFCDKVYVGNHKNAECLALLRRYGITHLLNCDGLPVLRRERERRFDAYRKELGGRLEYEEILMEDHIDADMLHHFTRAFAFIEKATKVGRVLIYSDNVNTSGMIAIGYLVYRGVSLIDAAKRLKYHRNAALFNVGFMRQLITYAHDRQLLDGPMRFHARTDLAVDASRLRKRLRDPCLIKLF